MRWARAHVTPLVALRTVACSDRWAEAWPQITAHLRAQVGERQQARRALRALPRSAALPVEPTPAVPTVPEPTVYSIIEGDGDAVERREGPGDT